MREVLLPLIWTMLCSASFGQTVPMDFTRNVGAPISDLPASISPSDGKATLVADFDNPNSDSISVYLINNTDEDLVLNAQAGDVYLKLETKIENGTWTRAQPHEFDWCGNSYLVRSLVKKRHFYKIDGYQAVDGKKAKIRFRLYRQGFLDLVTAEGNGFVLEADKRLASLDRLAIETGSLSFVESIATGNRIIPNVKKGWKDMQMWAIFELGSGRFPVEQSLPILNRIGMKFPDRKGQVAYAVKRLMQVPE